MLPFVRICPSTHYTGNSELRNKSVASKPCATVTGAASTRTLYLIVHTRHPVFSPYGFLQ